MAPMSFWHGWLPGLGGAGVRDPVLNWSAVWRILGLLGSRVVLGFRLIVVVPLFPI